jgi:CDP-paratose 2-epimerase
LVLPTSSNTEKSHKNNTSIPPLTIAGSGKQVRDVLHADDLVKLYQAAYDNKTKLNGEIFNIGGGAENSLSLIELFSMPSKVLSIPPISHTKQPRRSSDQDLFIACIDKASQILDWQPETIKQDGISMMIDRVKSIRQITHEPIVRQKQ